MKITIKSTSEELVSLAVELLKRSKLCFEVPTSELVEWLKFRDGVAATQAEPYEPYVVKGDGPATILVVKD